MPSGPPFPASPSSRATSDGGDGARAYQPAGKAYVSRIAARNGVARALAWAIALSPLLFSAAVAILFIALTNADWLSLKGAVGLVVYALASLFAFDTADSFVHMSDWGGTTYALSDIVRDLPYVWAMFLPFWAVPASVIGLVAACASHR